MSNPLRIDERVLHFLSGVSYLDERLQGLVEPCPAPGELPESQRVAVVRVAEAWSGNTQLGGVQVIQLCGNDAAGKRAVAAVACAAMGMQLRAVRTADLPPVLPSAMFSRGCGNVRRFSRTARCC
ncbi:MAG: hypothetical protein U0231_12845 [Nitrospiraceae bacterium]